MKITLLRHAMTEGNSKKQYIGRTDEDILQAPKCVSEEGGVLYVTPLKRTSQTARAMFPNKKPVVVSALAEMDFGDFEGKSYVDMEYNKPYRAWVDGGCIDTCPGGEARDEFISRVKKGFLEVVHSSDEDLIFVLHGGVIMAIMYSFFPSNDYFAWRCENCSGYEFEFENSLKITNVVEVKA